MSAQGILTTEDLAKILGYEPTSKAAIEGKLTKAGIVFFRSRRGPWTTIDLVNKAGGIAHNQPAKDEPLL